MKILNLDQSTKITGYSVFEDGKLIEYGIVKSDINEKNPIERMCQMKYEIISKINNIKPDVVFFEDCQYQQNMKTFQQLSQMQGVLIGVLNDMQLPFYIVYPTEWKSLCGIKGRARAEQKKNTIMYVKENFGLDLSEDECDAIGIGIWALNKLKIKVVC